MKQITPQELKAKIDNKEDFELIDVREIYEYEDYNINGKHIPLGEVMNNLDKIDTSKPVIFCCNSGKKSRAITIAVTKKLNSDNIYSLVGGVTNYYTEIEA
ncbi:rhodanese-like domain-containing protein [Vicingus serpentipes]|jgi:rhodanese-related sulfurtransferase|uniref:Rhodanese-like domain-containing protein n=1 Tax=Vicingus serpentipes TaxID=1926625 RepID=A0A5C6RXE5_9FLAO|nr:rhodanese-like domain-containing protein [Vicingus serpentipes]TXB66981.1 rhodanese-like domain-containing protein [Vicingus serpentipes]